MKGKRYGWYPPKNNNIDRNRKSKFCYVDVFPECSTSKRNHSVQVVPWLHVGILWQNYRHKLYPFVLLSIGKVHKLTDNAILWQFPNDLLLLPNVRFHFALIPTQISGGDLLMQNMFDAQKFDAGILTLDSNLTQRQYGWFLTQKNFDAGITELCRWWGI